MIECRVCTYCERTVRYTYISDKCSTVGMAIVYLLAHSNDFRAVIIS